MTTLQDFMSIVSPAGASYRKVRVAKEGVALFNSTWPCSTLRDCRAYWFEFDPDGNLVDTDCPEHDDGPAAAAMADDCKAFLQESTNDKA